MNNYHCFPYAGSPPAFPTHPSTSHSLVPCSPFPYIVSMTNPAPTAPFISAEAARKALKQVKDPELGLNIIDIGLIYDVAVDEDGVVNVKMTLTSPGCPSGAEIMADAKMVLEQQEGVTAAEVELVWEPYWTPDKMDPRVRTFMGF